MDTPERLERIRDWVEGRLDPDERTRFERELDADADLRELAEQYASVHELTAALEVVPSNASSLEELERRLDEDVPTVTVRPAGTQRHVVAAAAILLVSAGLWFFTGPGERAQPDAVELRTIPLSAGTGTVEPVIPTALANFQPVKGGGIQWVRDLNEASELAAVTGRPMLVYKRFKECKLADEVQNETLCDERILALAEECVPCIVDLDDLDAEERQNALADGYPVVELQGAAGDVVVRVAGEITRSTSCGTLGDSLKKGLASGCSSGTLTFDEGRDLASLHARARKAEEARRFGDARRFYEEIVVAGGSCGPFVQAGELGMKRVALAARDTLVGARDAVDGDDVNGAIEQLTTAIEHFRGTPHQFEIERVLEVVRSTRAFPPIAWANDA